KFPVFVPVFGTERSSTQFRGVEEQVFRAMQAVTSLSDRHAFAKMVGAKVPHAIQTADVEKSLGSADKTRRYLETRYAKLAFALTGEEARKKLDAGSEASGPIISPGGGEPETAKRKLK